MIEPESRSSALPALSCAAVVVAVALWTLYPGWYSFDSAWQLQQAMGFEFSDLQPPLMALLWSGLLALGFAPGALMVAHLLALAIGCMGLSRALRNPAAMLLPLVLLWPPFLVLLGHLWADVSLAAALTLAAGMIAAAGPIERRRLAWLALVPLAYAVGVRHNALPAAVPLLMLALARNGAGPRNPWAGLAAAVLIALLAFAASLLLARSLVARPMPSWTPTAIWDLSAVSVATDRLLLPAGMHGPGLSVAELRPLLNADNALTILTGARSGINNGIDGLLPEAILRDLRERWLGLPLSHPREWLAHRARVGWSLFGPQRADKDENLIMVPTVVAREGNPRIEANPTAANALLLRGVRAMRDGPLLMPAAYLGLSLLALALALRRRFAGDRGLVLALVASAWLYAAPLPFIIPSSELRYALWPMLAAALALALALGARYSRPRDLSQAPR